MRVCIQCARGGCAFYFRIGAHPFIARLRQHVVPPQSPQLFSIRVWGSPPKTPLKGAFLARCFASQLCIKCAFHSNHNGDGLVSGCGSSRPVPAAPTTVRVACRWQQPRCTRTGRDRPFKVLGWAGPARGGGAGAGSRGRPLYWRTAEMSIAGTTVLAYREALPSLTVLTGRWAGGLGRSLERPCKRSAGLSFWV